MFFFFLNPWVYGMKYLYGQKLVRDLGGIEYVFFVFFFLIRPLRQGVRSCSKYLNSRGVV